MRKLLYCSVGSNLVVEGINYIVTAKNKFMINGTKAYRINLSNDFESIFLEIKREMALNYQIFKYSLLESLEQNRAFLSVLGTNTLGYNNPKLSSANIYQKVRVKKERYTLVKHIVSKDELPEDYQAKGYYQDEYGEYYFFTKKYSPLIKEFKDSKMQVWEYRQKDNNLRLLVETKIQKDAKIFIYKGKELKASEVATMDEEELKISLQPKMIQIPDTLHHSLTL